MLDRYFTLEDPRRIEPAHRELSVEAELASGLHLRGYIDRLDVAPGGEIRIVDYKTGTSPPEEFEARALFQMRFYALAIWRARGQVPAMLQLMYLGNGEIVRYQPDESDLLATERKVEALWQAIERALAAATGGRGPGASVSGARTRRSARRSGALPRRSRPTCPPAWPRCPAWPRSPPPAASPSAAGEARLRRPAAAVASRPRRAAARPRPGRRRGPGRYRQPL